LLVDPLYQSLTDDVYQALKALPRQRPEQIDEKSHLDFVTDLDLKINCIVTRLIETYFPDDSVISEETWGRAGALKTGAIWVIDPLDGTSNFVSALPFYACSIARIVNEKVDFGLVIDLVNNDVFSAQRGHGAFLNNAVIKPASSPASFLGISTGFIREASDLLHELTGEVKFRLLGAQSLHLCYVACGRLRGAVNLESKIWDDIAGALIVTEAGGFYTSLYGIDLGKVDKWSESGLVAGLALAERNDRLQSVILRVLE
jgi:myo-inositol-1(or 4)-monophosphatase